MDGFGNNYNQVMCPRANTVSCAQCQNFANCQYMMGLPHLIINNTNALIIKDLQDEIKSLRDYIAYLEEYNSHLKEEQDMYFKEGKLSGYNQACNMPRKQKLKQFLTNLLLDDSYED